jgi:hypothetical protein
MMRFAQVDTIGPVEPLQDWTVWDAGSGRQVLWEGFCTGPEVLAQNELERLSQVLVGTSLTNLRLLSERRLLPNAGLDAKSRAVILYTATPLKKCFEADLQAVLKGTRAEDPTSYIEARSVYLGRPGDLIVGRIAPWVSAARLSSATPIQVPGIRYYYLSHALLKLAEAHAASMQPAIAALVDYLKRHPDCVFKLYALDVETQLFLVWLCKTADLPYLNIDSNSPAVSENWNSKASLHPAVEEVQDLGRELQAHELLLAESERNMFYRELGLLIPRLPGYTIRRRGREQDVVASQLCEAAGLLRSRYGIERGCFKPSKGSTGARILKNINLSVCAPWPLYLVAPC